MTDKDSNGVDILDRFLSYKSRFVQFGMTQQVYFDVIRYIETLRAERDEARRDACEFGAMLETDTNPNYDPESGDFAKIAMRIAYTKGWDCWRGYNA